MNKKKKIIATVSVSTGIIAIILGAGLGTALSSKSNSDKNQNAESHAVSVDWSLLRLGDTLQVQGITKVSKGHAHINAATIADAKKHGYTFTVKEPTTSGIGYNELFTVVAKPLPGFVIVGKKETQFTSQAEPAGATASVIAKRAAVKAIALIEVDDKIKNFSTKVNTFLTELKTMRSTLRTHNDIDQISVEATLDAEITLRNQYNAKVKEINTNLVPLIENIKTNNIPGLTLPTNPSSVVINSLMSQINSISFTTDANGYKYTAKASIDAKDARTLNIEVGIANGKNALIATNLIKVTSLKTQIDQDAIDRKKSTISSISIPTLIALESGATLPALSSFDYNAKQTKANSLKTQIAASTTIAAITPLETELNSIISEINDMNADIKRANNLLAASSHAIITSINSLTFPQEVILDSSATVATPFDYTSNKNAFDSKVADASVPGKTLAQLKQLKTELDQIVQNTNDAMSARTAANNKAQNLISSIKTQISSLVFPQEVTLASGATVASPYDYAAAKSTFDTKVLQTSGKTLTQLTQLKADLDKLIHDTNIAMSARTTANNALNGAIMASLQNEIAAIVLPDTSSITTPFKENISSPNSFDIDAKVSEFGTLKSTSSTLTTSSALSTLKTNLLAIKNGVEKWLDIFNEYKKAIDANYQVAANTSKQAEAIDQNKGSDVFIQGKPAGFTLSVIGKTISSNKLSITFDYTISFTYKGIYIELPLTSSTVTGFVDPVSILNAETKSISFTGDKTTTLASAVTKSQLTISSTGTPATIISLTPNNVSGSLDVEYQVHGASVTHRVTISGFTSVQNFKDHATATFDHSAKATTLASNVYPADLTHSFVDSGGLSLNVVIESIDKDDAKQLVVINYHIDGASRPFWGKKFTLSGFQAPSTSATSGWSSFTGSNVEINGLYDTEKNQDDDATYKIKAATLDSATVTVSDIANTFDFGNGDNIDKIKETTKNTHIPHQFRDSNNYHYYVDSWNTITISHREDGKVTLSGTIYAIDGTGGYLTIDPFDHRYWKVISSITLTGLSSGAGAQISRLKSEIAAIKINPVPVGLVNPSYDFVAKFAEFNSLKASATPMVSVGALNSLKTHVQNFANDFNQKILEGHPPLPPTVSHRAATFKNDASSFVSEINSIYKN